MIKQIEKHTDDSSLALRFSHEKSENELTHEDKNIPLKSKSTSLSAVYISGGDGKPTGGFVIGGNSCSPAGRIKLRKEKKSIWDRLPAVGTIIAVISAVWGIIRIFRRKR